MRHRNVTFANACLAILCLWITLAASGQENSATNPAAAPPQSPSQTQSSAQAPFHLHEFHLKQVGLDCDGCHVPAKSGSVILQRPGHDQCTPCHQDDFNKVLKEKVCVQCHTVFPPTSAEELLPFPRFKNERPIVFEFSHAKHVDPHARIDSRTGFRADCTFCHKFQADGAYASFGNHEVCAGCHSKAGMKPLLSDKSTTKDCQGCHRVEEIENPGPASAHSRLASFVISGKIGRDKMRD